MLGKLGQLGTGRGSRDLLFNFGPLCIYGTAEYTNFKFGTWIDHWRPMQTVAKLGQMGTCPGLRDLLLHFDFL